MRKIINSILDEINSSETNYAKSSYKIATETIKTLFAKRGAELGYCSAANRNLNIFQDFEYDEGEWLFDFVWYKMHEYDDQLMTEVPLVLESELSSKSLGGLKVDFDKLLVATSSTKVFVTSIHFLEEKRSYIQKVINNFTNFRKDETLYLIVWDEKNTDNFSLEEFNKEVL